MSPAAYTDDSLTWLRERLLVPGHPLALTLPYAHPDLRDRLVALHAVVGGIAAVPGEVSDADVARRKLGWWRQALDERLPHPAVRAWVESGAAERTPAPAFVPLIEAVAAEIEPPRFENAAGFHAHCRAVAGPVAALEARLVDPDADPESPAADALADMAGAGYRARIVRDLVVDAGRQRWLVPLDAQAEHRITRREVAEASDGMRLRALVRDLAGEAAAAVAAAAGRLSAAGAWRHRHLVLRHELDRRLALKLVRRPHRVVRERVAAGGVGDALALWRRARTLRRRAPRPERA